MVVESGKEGGLVIAAESSVVRGGERVTVAPAPATTSDSRGGKGVGARTIGRDSRAGGRQPPAPGPRATTAWRRWCNLHPHSLLWPRIAEARAEVMEEGHSQRTEREGGGARGREEAGATTGAAAGGGGGSSRPQEPPGGEGHILQF